MSKKDQIFRPGLFLFFLYLFSRQELFPACQHPGISQHHQGGPAMGTEGLPGRIDDPHLLISHFTQFFGKLLHIPVHPGLHVVVESKHAAFFQHTQTFQKQSLLVCAVDIMIDIVADHGVKSLVRKVQLPGIAIKEPAPFRYALAPGITLSRLL